MAVITTAPAAQQQRAVADRRPWLALGLAVLSATSYVVVLVVPWLAVGAPDPSQPYASELGQPWSYPAVAGPLVGFLAFWAIGVAPFACVGVAWWSAHRLWVSRATRVGRWTVCSALVVSVATFAWFVAQGAALLIWAID